MHLRPLLLVPVLCALFLGLLSVGAAADVIHLTTGGKVVGTIEEETETRIVVRVHGGRMTFPRSIVRDIVREARPRENPPPEVPPPEAAPEAPRPDGTVPLREALDDGSITAEVRGQGLTRVALELAPAARRHLSVFVPAGTYLVAAAGKGKAPQDMLVIRSAVVRVEDETETASLDVACARWERRVPGPDDVLQIARRAPHPRLTRLAGVLQAAEADAATSQAAVWIVTNDTDYEGLGRMSVRAAGSMSSSRLIAEEDAVRAMTLVEASGVSLEDRRIAGDSRVLVCALSHPTLGTWALARLRAQGIGDTVEAVVVKLLQRAVSDASGDAKRLADDCCRIASELEIRSALPTLRQGLTRPGRAVHRPTFARAFARLALVLDAPADGVEQLLWLLTQREVQAIAADAFEDEAFRARVTNPVLRTRVGRALTRLLVDGRELSPSALKPALQIWLDALDSTTLVEASKSTEAGVRKVAVHLLLSRAGPEALNAVVARLEEMPDLALKLSTRHDARPHLLRLARSKHLPLRRAIAQALGRAQRGNEVERTLTTLLGDEDAQVRAAAVQSVGHGGYRGAAVAVRARLRSDADELVRRRAAQALMDLLQGDALPALRAARERARSEAERKELTDMIRLASVLTRSGGR